MLHLTYSADVTLVSTHTCADNGIWQSNLYGRGGGYLPLNPQFYSYRIQKAEAMLNKQPHAQYLTIPKEPEEDMDG